jgi:hypothetical protein
LRPENLSLEFADQVNGGLGAVVCACGIWSDGLCRLQVLGGEMMMSAETLVLAVAALATLGTVASALYVKFKEQPSAKVIPV